MKAQSLHSPPSAAMTVEAAARRIGVSRAAIYLAIKEKRLVAEVVDGRIQVSAEDVERHRRERLAWLERATAALRRA